MKTLLEIEDVRFSYGPADVLRGISLRADAGEFVALLGTNGAGKSTLLDLIAGLRDLQAGSIAVAGFDTRGRRSGERARAVSHLPQMLDADLPFSAAQVVAMGRYPHTDRWFESDDDRREIEQSMRRTRCWEHRARAFRSLSGGERQRVLLAACLAQSAEVMLLDEPSTFLDIAAQLECFSLLREQAEAGRLCVAVTHDLNLALRFCTRLVVLEQGRVAQDLQAADIGHDDAWLRLFSPELRLGQTDAGRPWVWYA